MARNGSGVYSLPAGNPVVTLTAISSVWANSTMTDLGNEITNSIDKGGRTVATANLPMGGFKHTGVGDANASGQYLNYGQGAAVLDGLTINTTLAGAGVAARLATPGPIGSTTPSTGAFTTLSASSTVSGSGFSTYLAAPPASGGTVRNSGNFTNVTTRANAAGGSSVNIDTFGTLQYGFLTYLNNGSARWQLYKSNDAESGGNAGSNLFLQCIADDGSTFIATAWGITRSTGRMFLGATPAIGDNSVNVATTAYADRAAFAGATWQDVTVSRAWATNYTNSTGRAILVFINATSTAAGDRFSMTVASQLLGNSSSAYTSGVQGVFGFMAVPPGAVYSAQQAAGTPTLARWIELRT